MKSCQVKFLTPSYNDVQLYPTGNSGQVGHYTFSNADGGQTYLGTDPNIRIYVYIFSSAELGESDSKLIQNNPNIKIRNKYFWLQRTIFIARNYEYHFINTPGSEPVRNQGYTTPVQTDFGRNKSIPIDNYFCVSRVNFSGNRIKKLLDELVKGNYTRFEKIDIEQSPVAGGVYQVTLTDYLGVAQWLHSLYARSYDEYLEWAGNEERTLLRTINDMMQQIITNDSKFKEYLFFQPMSKTFAGTIYNFEEWRRIDDAKGRDKIAEYEKYCAVLTKFWLTKKELLAVLEDYDETEELQEQREKELETFLADINMSEAGRVYLKDMADNPAGNWIFKYVFDIARPANDATWAIMELFSTINGRRVIDIIVDAINRRLRNIGVVVRIEESQRAVGSVLATEAVIKVYKNRALIDNIVNGPLPEGLKIVLSIIKLRSLLRDNPTENIIAKTNEVVDIIGNLIIISGKIITGRNERIGLKLVCRGYKIGGVVALVSTVFNVIDMIEAKNKGDTSVVVGNIIGAAGGVLTAISSFCLSVGALTIYTPPGIILGIVGAVLGLSGAIIAIATTDKSIETWFKKSLWGSNPFDSDYWNRRARDIGIRLQPNNNKQIIELQLAELQQIIYRYKIDFKDNGISISSFYMSREHTGIYLYVWRVDSRSGNRTVLLGEKIENSNIRSSPRSNEAKLDLIITSGNRKSVTGNIVTVKDLEDHKKGIGVDVYCAVFIDIFGDGSVITPYHQELQNNIKSGNPAVPITIPRVIDSEYQKEL
jgi:hypothetical protein